MNDHHFLGNLLGWGKHHPGFRLGVVAQALDTPMGEVMAMAEGEADPEPVTEDLQGLEGEAETDPQHQHQVGWWYGCVWKYCTPKPNG